MLYRAQLKSRYADVAIPVKTAIKNLKNKVIK